MLLESVHTPFGAQVHRLRMRCMHRTRDGCMHPSPPDGYTYRVDEERYGPLTLVRVVKEDGRALILFARA